MRSLENTSYLSASAVVIHYEEALYQVYKNYAPYLLSSCHSALQSTSGHHHYRAVVFGFGNEFNIREVELF